MQFALSIYLFHFLPCNSNSQPFLFYLFFFYQVISNLEGLALEWKHSSVLNSKLESGDYPNLLEYLIWIRLYFDVDDDGNPIFPIQTLQKASPNLKAMIISSCRSLEVFRTQIPEINKNLMLTQLCLIDVWKLKSIGSGEGYLH